MNLHRLLAQRAEQGKPVKVGLIGAGKFGSMLLAQLQRTTGMHLVGVSDLDPQRARDALLHVGWPQERIGAGSLDDALRDAFLTAGFSRSEAAELHDQLGGMMFALIAPELAGRPNRAAFERGLELLHDGLEARLRRR